MSSLLLSNTGGSIQTKPRVQLINWRLLPQRDFTAVFLYGVNAKSRIMAKTSGIVERVSARQIQTKAGTVIELLGPSRRDAMTKFFCDDFISHFSQEFPPDWQQLVDAELARLASSPNSLEIVRMVDDISGRQVLSTPSVLSPLEASRVQGITPTQNLSAEAPQLPSLSHPDLMTAPLKEKYSQKRPATVLTSYEPSPKRPSLISTPKNWVFQKGQIPEQTSYVCSSKTRRTIPLLRPQRSTVQDDDNFAIFPATEKGDGVPTDELIREFLDSEDDDDDEAEPNSDRETDGESSDSEKKKKAAEKSSRRSRFLDTIGEMLTATPPRRKSFNRRTSTAKPLLVRCVIDSSDEESDTEDMIAQLFQCPSQNIRKHQRKELPSTAIEKKILREKEPTPKVSKKKLTFSWMVADLEKLMKLPESTCDNTWAEEDYAALIEGVRQVRSSEPVGDAWREVPKLQPRLAERSPHDLRGAWSRIMKANKRRRVPKPKIVRRKRTVLTVNVAELTKLPVPRKSNGSHRVWSKDEYLAIKDGIEKLGRVGKCAWREIRETNDLLANRSDLEIKDAWYRLVHVNTRATKAKKVRKPIDSDEAIIILSSDEDENESSQPRSGSNESKDEGDEESGPSSSDGELDDSSIPSSSATPLEQHCTLKMSNPGASATDKDDTANPAECAVVASPEPSSEHVVISDNGEKELPAVRSRQAKKPRKVAMSKSADGSSLVESVDVELQRLEEEASNQSDVISGSSEKASLTTVSSKRKTKAPAKRGRRKKCGRKKIDYVLPRSRTNRLQTILRIAKLHRTAKTQSANEKSDDQTEVVAPEEATTDMLQEAGILADFGGDVLPNETPTIQNKRKRVAPKRLQMSPPLPEKKRKKKVKKMSAALKARIFRKPAWLQTSDVESNSLPQGEQTDAAVVEALDKSPECEEVEVDDVEELDLESYAGSEFEFSTDDGEDGDDPEDKDFQPKKASLIEDEEANEPQQEYVVVCRDINMEERLGVSDINFDELTKYPEGWAKGQWTKEEYDAIKAGVQRFGLGYKGHWGIIRNYYSCLAWRSATDVKEAWYRFLRWNRRNPPKPKHTKLPDDEETGGEKQQGNGLGEKEVDRNCQQHQQVCDPQQQEIEQGDEEGLQIFEHEAAHEEQGGDAEPNTASIKRRDGEGQQDGDEEKVEKVPRTVEQPPGVEVKPRGNGEQPNDEEPRCDGVQQGGGEEAEEGPQTDEQQPEARVEKPIDEEPQHDECHPDDARQQDNDEEEAESQGNSEWNSSTASVNVCWGEEEFKCLRKGMEKFGKGRGGEKWHKIQRAFDCFANKTPEQIRTGWYRLLKKEKAAATPKQTKVRQPKMWTPKEYQAIKEGYEKFGMGKWREIQKAYACLNDRSNIQVRDAWKRLICNPNLVEAVTPVRECYRHNRMCDPSKEVEEKKQKRDQERLKIEEFEKAAENSPQSRRIWNGEHYRAIQEIMDKSGNGAIGWANHKKNYACLAAFSAKDLSIAGRRLRANPNLLKREVVTHQEHPWKVRRSRWLKAVKKEPVEVEEKRLTDEEDESTETSTRD